MTKNQHKWASAWKKQQQISVRPAKTQISLGIPPVWSESSLSAWRKLGSLATHWAHSDDTDQTGRMPRLIRVFAGRTVILLVLSWGGSNANLRYHIKYQTERDEMQKQLSKASEAWLKIRIKGFTSGQFYPCNVCTVCICHFYEKLGTSGFKSCRYSWVEPKHNKTYKVTCAQSRFSSACTSLQSLLSAECTAKTSDSMHRLI